MVPEAKDIDHIVNAVTDPTVSKELLKDALVKFNSYVEFIEGGRKYADVLQTKLALEQSIDETRGSLANLEQRMAATQKTVSQYVQVYEADALRQQWLKEAGTFFDGWRGLERTLVDAREVLALYQALLSARDYLLEVRRCFEAA
jgi:hypothetical protein